MGETSTRKPIYTAEADVTGGRFEGHGRTSDGELEVDIRIPADLGGPGGGTNPEQLFAVGYGACFENAVHTVSRRRKLEAGDVRVTSRVHLVPQEDRSFGLAVEMDVELPSVEDREAALDLLRAAHRVCPYSNATRGNIPVTIRLDGQAID